jgi:hypothetical protein
LAMPGRRLPFVTEGFSPMGDFPGFNGVYHGSKTGANDWEDFRGRTPFSSSS